MYNLLIQAFLINHFPKESLDLLPLRSLLTGTNPQPRDLFCWIDQWLFRTEKLKSITYTSYLVTIDGWYWSNKAKRYFLFDSATLWFNVPLLLRILATSTLFRINWTKKLKINWYSRALWSHRIRTKSFFFVPHVLEIMLWRGPRMNLEVVISVGAVIGTKSNPGSPSHLLRISSWFQSCLLFLIHCWFLLAALQVPTLSVCELIPLVKSLEEVHSLLALE